MPNPVILIILDGWGYSEATQYNAIAKANTPCWDKIMAQHPQVLLECGGLNVGLPAGQMGNSEVGHITIGAGRIVYQDLTKINLSIANKTFFENKALKQAIVGAAKHNKKLHIMGLVSPGGVHSHEQHLFAILDMARRYKCVNTLIHAFLDGRDVPPKSATASLEKLEKLIKNLNVGRIASLCGRYYAMDRDKRYDRTKSAYDLVTDQQAEFTYKDAILALEAAYARGETDEFIKPSIIASNIHTNNNIEDGDSVIFFNYRADRARQLSYALISPNFSGFARAKFPKLGCFVTFTDYAHDLHVPVAYPKAIISNSLGELVQNNNLTQLRIAETEKYAHVTFFFNGGQEKIFNNEDRVLIPSPKVATYDLQPEMSAIALTDHLVAAILLKKYDFIVCNYANADMVGHTGNFNAAVKAVEVLDSCLARIMSAVSTVHGDAVITADHGNVELMYDQKNLQPHTAHSKNLVPCVYVGSKIAKVLKYRAGLEDIAPTILKLLGIKKPRAMTGNSIFAFK